MPKIYTKTGDDGTTGLFSGNRIHKSDPRLECYGTIDELNAAIGWARVVTPLPQLQRIQHELFVLGSHVATPSDSPAAAKLPPLHDGMVNQLEREIDAADGQLEPLRNFILPGGAESAARLHLARTICRRAERIWFSLAESDRGPAAAGIYLNRLSDWLFAMARLANQRSCVPDVIWQKPVGEC